MDKSQKEDPPNSWTDRVLRTSMQQAVEMMNEEHIQRNTHKEKHNDYNHARN